MAAPSMASRARAIARDIPSAEGRFGLDEYIDHVIQALHYGVFAGSRWESEIYPVIRRFVAEHSTARQPVSA